MVLKKICLRIGQKAHKKTHNSLKIGGSSLILTNLVGVHPRKIHKQFETDQWSGSREDVKKSKKFTTTTTDTGWSLE